MKLGALASLLGAAVDGDGGVVITGAGALDAAGPPDIAFVRGEKEAKRAGESRAGALVVPRGMRVDKPFIPADDPLEVFSRVLEILYPEKRPEPGVHPLSWIGRDVVLGEGVFVGPLASVGDGTRIGNNSRIMAGARIGPGCVIGADCAILENAVIMEKTRMGAGCIIHPGAVIGSDGFGYVRMKDGKSRKIRHIGIVILEDDVEIGACSSVDRAMLGATLIKRGVKIDNQVQVGHNVTIGEDAVVAGCAGIAGSAVIGRNVMIGGASAISDHVKIADGVIIAGLTGVHTDLDEPGVYSGPLAMKNMAYKRFMLSGRRLDRLEARIKDLEKRRE
jgi:UDP-3-O-[3-hydroxymyristoyl] glucosamine N-acyltransferase